MDIINLNYEEENPSDLLNTLNTNVFHLTTKDAFEAIKSDGKINNNKDEKYPLNTSSGGSHGRLHGYVCLFDLRDHNSGRIDMTLSMKYNFLGPSWFREVYEECIKYNLVYLILSEQHYDKLIYYEDAERYYKENKKWLHCIPHIEVWVNDHIPIDWISKVFVANICCPAPPEGGLARVHHNIAYKNKTS